MYKHGIILFVLAFYSTICIGQTIQYFDINYELALEKNINYPSKFFDRFNFYDSVWGVDTRSRSIELLFSNPELLYDSANNFISTVCKTEHPIFINFRDTNWYATCKATFFYKKRTLSVLIFLKPHKIGQSNKYSDSKYGWVVTDIYCKTFDSLFFKTRDKSRTFYPNQSDGKFVYLRDVLLDSPKTFLRYIDASTPLSHINIFSYLISTGELRLKQMESPEFTFLQVPGWKFSIKNVVTTDGRTGWFIDKLRRINIESSQCD